MAKRGERFPFRVSFEWSNGVHGTKALGSVDLVDEFVRQLEATAHVRDLDVVIRIARPEQPLEVRTITANTQE